MAESNATQVILTDDGIKIIKAQNTADEAVSGVDKINDSNQLGPAEKQTLQRKYQTDKLVYDMDIKMLTDAGLPTTELQSAMNALDSFITPYFQDMGKTEQVDRDKLNQVFNGFDTEDKNANNAFNSMVSNAANDAKEAGEKAQEAGEEAKASAGQAQVDAATAQQKAQSSIDQLTVVDSKVTKLSTSTTAQFNTLNNGYQEVISTVNNINVGGRNYILNSDFYITSGQKNVLSSVEPNEYSGKKITVSVDIEINNLKTIADSGHTRVGYEASFNASDNSTVYVGVWKNLTKSDIGKSFKYRATNNTYDLTEKTITSINDGNGALGGVYIQGITADSIKVGHPKLEIATKATDWSPAPEDLATVTDITASIDNIHLGVKNADGSTATFNMNSNTILFDANKIIFSGKTSILDGTIDTAKIANASINTAQIADGAINNAKIANLDAGKITTGIMDASHINVDQLIANGINGKTITGITINTPNLNLGDNGQITGSYSVHDDIGWFQPINGTGSLKIANGYIQSTAHIVYYNKILNGIGGDKWGHWASSTQFVPAPDQAHPDIGNVAESTLTPAFLKLDILSDDKSAVNSRVYIDGTGLYINDGNGSQAISAMLSDYELVSSGMAYLNSGIQMKQEATFTFGNLAMSGYHTISMLDGNALYFTDGQHPGNPIELVAKTFTKSSRLSIKHDITPLSTAESSRLLNAIDVEKFRYTNDNATYKYQYGGVIDDVNSPGNKQYSMPPELLSEDGTGINLDSLTGILVKRVQDQDKTIAELSIRLTRLEMEK